MSMHTLEDCIRDIGEIPYCLCGCGHKVNVNPKYYSIYKRENGYKKFINGHHARVNNDMKGKHHSEEAKLKMRKNRQVWSEERKKKFSENRLGNKNPNYGISPKNLGYGNRSYYQSPLQGEVCFRSSYELKYAQYLDSIGEPWFYEAEALEMVINGKETTYRPDFSLPLKCEFIEIKGYMSQKSQLKCDKFKEELDDEELMGIFGYKVLFREDLQKLGIKI